MFTPFPQFSHVYKVFFKTVISIFNFFVTFVTIKRNSLRHNRFQRTQKSPLKKKGDFLIELQNYNSLRPSNALARVISSAYSRSEPTGIPSAILETLISKGFNNLAIYKVVASPSTEGFSARMTS